MRLQRRRFCLEGAGILEVARAVVSVDSREWALNVWACSTFDIMALAKITNHDGSHSPTTGAGISRLPCL
jgi:hypothetical protein